MRNSAWLAAVPLIVITHGWQDEDKFPGWPYDMACVINATHKNPASLVELDNSIVDLTGVIKEKNAPHFILFDWSAKSRDIGSAKDEKVAGVLAQAIRERIENLHEKHGGTVDLTLYGHSRGAYVVCNALKTLGKNPPEDLGCVSLIILDAQAEGDDGTIEANPGGIVDWTQNYYQYTDFYHGYPVTGALNVNLTSVLKRWSGRVGFSVDGGEHAEVHDWFHHLLDTDDESPLRYNYRDRVLARQKLELYHELRNRAQETRMFLYGQAPVVENFSGHNVPWFRLSQAKSTSKNSTPVPVPWDKSSANRIVESVLRMTPAEPLLGASAFSLSPMDGNFSAEFTVQMKSAPGSVCGDGMTFAIIDANHKKRLGLLGGQLGFGGLSGLAVAFDTHRNDNYGDPDEADTRRRISLRYNGSPKWQELPGAVLPEPLSSGNPFRVRVTLHDRKLTVQAYSYELDKLTVGSKMLPKNVKIPDSKLLGFTAATGENVQQHVVDNIIFVKE